MTRKGASFPQAGFLSVIAGLVEGTPGDWLHLPSIPRWGPGGRFMPPQQFLHGGQVAGHHGGGHAQHHNEMSVAGIVRPEDALWADAYGDLHGIQRAGASVGDGQAVIQIGGLRFLTQKNRILDVSLAVGRQGLPPWNPSGFPEPVPEWLRAGTCVREFEDCLPPGLLKAFGFSFYEGRHDYQGNSWPAYGEGGFPREWEAGKRGKRPFRRGFFDTMAAEEPAFRLFLQRE